MRQPLFAFRFSLFAFLLAAWLVTCPLLAQEVVLSTPLHYRGFDPAQPLLTVQGSGNQTGNIVEFRDHTTGAPVSWMDFNGQLNAVSLSVVWLNKVCYADQMPQTSAGAKIAACFAALSATGGTVDAHGLLGGVISQNLWSGVTKPITLLLGVGTYTVSVAQVILASNSRIVGSGRNATVLKTSGAIILFTLGDATHQLYAPSFRDLTIDGNIYTGTNGVNIVKATDGLMENVNVQNFSSHNVYFSAVNSAAYFWTFIKCLFWQSYYGWGVLDANGNAGATSFYDCVFSSNGAGGVQTSSNSVGIYGGEVGDNKGVQGAVWFNGNYGGGGSRRGATLTNVFFEMSTTGYEVMVGNTGVQYNAVSFTGNKFTSSTNYGIQFLTASQGVHISGNTFVNHTTASFLFTATPTMADLSGNDFSDPFVSIGTPPAFLDVQGVVQASRLKASYGTPLVASNFALHANWGNTPAATISAVVGTDQATTFTVSAGTANFGANPTVILTFKDLTWTNNPVCTANRGDATAPTTGFATVTTTATAMTLTFQGTPGVGTYSFNVVCMGR